MKRKIAYIDLDEIKNPLLGAGQAVATFEVGKRLVQKGHEVTVYCSRYPNSQDRYDEGIYYKHVGVGTSNIKFNNAMFIMLIPFLVQKINADIIIESFIAPTSTIGTPWYTRTPVIGLPSMFNAEEFTKKYKLPFHIIQNWGVKAYKYFMPYSDIDSMKIKKLNPKIDYKIIPQGVDEKFFNRKRATPQHILFLSRLDIEQKGIDLLLNAYKIIKNQTKYPLVIAGHGPDEKKISELINKLGLRDQVTMVGSAYGEKKEKLIAQAICVAFPSRHDELSLWALEALASGMPIVAFDLPESKWMQTSAALKVKPFDIEEYGQNLLKIQNQELNEQLSQNARALAAKYSWESVCEETEKYIEYVLEKEKRAGRKQE